MTSPSPHEIALKLRWCGLTDRGRFRTNNEDTFLALQFDAREVSLLGKTGEVSTQEKDFVFAVSDGMGGARSGEFASRIAVDKITSLLPRAFQQSAGGLNVGFSDVLSEVFEQAHQELTLLGRSYDECAGMGATLSLCWFTPLWMYFAHIGDSRIYYISKREGKLRQLTQDDTHVGWLYRNGQLNERQTREHPRRNSLQKALGAGHQFVCPQVGSVAFERGDLFLLCTDGLIEGLFDNQIAQHLQIAPAAETLENRAERLVSSALEQSGRDNTTAIVIEIL